MRIVILHHVIGCSAGTWLLRVVGHALVVSELHATDMLVEVNIDIVIVGWLCG